MHVPYEKELGPMKKYPRERLSKEILTISGKISVDHLNANNTGKNFHVVNNHDLRKSGFLHGSGVGTTTGLNFYSNSNKQNLYNKNNKLDLINRKSVDNTKLFVGNMDTNNLRKGNVSSSNFYKTTTKK